MGDVVSERIRLVRPTRHCEERMREARMAYKSLVYYLLHGAEEELPRELSQAKRAKYNGNEDVFYVRWGPYVFTCKNMTDVQNRAITRVITMIDQRETLHEVPPGEGRWTQ